MAESYVRPVLSAREPRSRKWPVWRFRLVSLVLLTLLVLGVIEGYNRFIQGDNRQDPGLTGEDVEGARRPSLLPH